jgi:hypothetical protein
LQPGEFSAHVLSIKLVEEDMLRAIYDGEKLSTWEKVTKMTSIRIDAAVSRYPS